ncbi:Glutamate carboxypeptidase 2 [Choanephora cucurbitarum]|uniref:Glutamate carboxypeptidase 2 n=2 Tax=Choanephora cucurbitarum TaxID=101091 RepID=A0A1C7NMH4_9FUNG|nr:Glutamate carboxypeptidase 2 [Choanephora cucurbitarum]
MCLLFVYRFARVSSDISSSELMELLQSIPSIQSIEHYQVHYASQTRLAGSKSDKLLAEWTKDTWIDFGITDTQIKTYYPTLNRPVQRRVALFDKEELIYEAELQVLDAYGRALPAFHAYSADGNVTAPIVYVDYGRRGDFQYLAIRDIELKGAIALMRAGGDITHSMKIKMAQEFECVGALVFSGPDDEDALRSSFDLAKHHSAQFVSLHAGDPFTPGTSAKEDATHIPIQEANSLPKIPSLPISFKDAQFLLNYTHGYGIQKPGGFRYFSGPSENKVNLVNINKYQVKPIWNVIGRIQGEIEPHQSVILGSHRDGWTNDAVNHSSGSAVLTELVRTLGILLKKGWKPRRTIIIASWDAGEYGSIGSVEWVEDQKEWLRNEAVAYLNVDYAVSGKDFNAQASPLLDRLLRQAAEQTPYPHSNQSVYDAWKNRQRHNAPFYLTSLRQGTHQKSRLVSIPNTDSDHLAFFHHLGIASLSIGFQGNQYSMNQDIDWIRDLDNLVFDYHRSLTILWSIMLTRLSNDPILPLYPHDYALQIESAVHTFSAYKGCLDLPRISSAVSSFKSMSDNFQTNMLKWANSSLLNKNYLHNLRKHIKTINERLIQLERTFIHVEGISPDRPWFGHVLYGPDLYTGSSVLFPGLSEAMEKDNATLALWAEERIVEAIHQAEKTLSRQ